MLLVAKITISFELTSGEERDQSYRATRGDQSDREMESRLARWGLDGYGRGDVRVGVVVGEGEVVVDEVKERLPTVS